MAARKLGEILVAGKRVSPADLKKALDAQLIFGGRLGTNLLDLGLLDEQSLTEALLEQQQVPAATPRMLEEPSPEALRLVPAAVAARLRAVPFALAGRELSVAMVDPLDPIALDELAFVSGCSIRAHLAPEARVTGALERHLGIARPARFLRIAQDGASPAAETAPSAAATGAATPAPASPPPEAPRPKLGELVLEDVLGLARGEAVTPAALRSSSAPPQALDAVLEELKSRAEEQRRRAVAARSPVTLAVAAARLASAESREDVGEALVDLARARHPRVMAWLVQQDRALGWLASCEGLAPETARRAARAAAVSLAEPSSLAEVVSSGKYHLGALTDRPGEARVVEALGQPRPASLLLLPVLMGGRVILVLQCDASGAPDAADLRVACEKAGLAMEALQLRARIRQI